MITDNDALENLGILLKKCEVEGDLRRFFDAQNQLKDALKSSDIAEELFDFQVLSFKNDPTADKLHKIYALMIGMMINYETKSNLH